MINLAKNKSKTISKKEAYSIQKNLYRNKIGAWKIGGTTKINQIYFKTNRIFIGPIFSKNIFKLNNKNLKQISFDHEGEFEIAIQISNQIEQVSEKNIHKIELTSLIKNYYCVIEFPLINYFPLNSLTNLIASGCANGYLMLIDTLPKSDTLNFFSSRISENFDMVKKYTYLYDLNIILEKFIKLTLNNNIKLKSNQIISLGGLTELIKFDNSSLAKLYKNQIFKF